MGFSLQRTYRRILDDFQKLKFELGAGSSIFLLGVFAFFVIFLIVPIFTILYWSITSSGNILADLMNLPAFFTGQQVEDFLFKPFLDIFKDSRIWGGDFGIAVSQDPLKATLSAFWMWAFSFLIILLVLYYWKIQKRASVPVSFQGKYMGWTIIALILFMLLFFVGFFWNELNMIKAVEIPISVEGRPNGTKWIIQGPNMGGLLNSIIVALATTIFSTIFGILFAFIMARYTFPGKNFFRPFILIPLIIPPFVSIIGFQMILGVYLPGNPAGLVNRFLFENYNMQIILGGSVGIVFVQFLHFYTLVYLNVYSSLVNIDPSLEESAENLGAKGSQLIRSITLPLAMPGLAAGAILAFILAIEDLGTPLIFNTLETGDTFEFIPTLVFKNVITAAISDKGYVVAGKYAALAAFLVFVAVVGFLLIRRFVSLKHYAMISKGRVGEPRTQPARSKLIVILWIVFLFFLPTALIPHIGTMTFAFGFDGFVIFSLLLGMIIPFSFGFYYLYKHRKKNIKRLGIGVMVGSIIATIAGFFVAIDWYIKNIAINETGLRNFLIFLNIGGSPDELQKDQASEILGSIVNMFVYSISATILIVVIATITAYLLARKNFPGKGLLDTIVTLPLAIPGIIIGFGYFIMFYIGDIKLFGFLDPIFNPVPLLIISYTVRKFTFTIRSAFAGMQQVDVQLEEASFNLGASRIKTLRSVTIPMVSMSVFSGGLISLVYCMSEVSTTIILLKYTFDAARFGTATWEIWNIYGDPFGGLGYPMAAVLGVLLMLIQAVSIFMTNVVLKSRSEAITGI
ncbi:MAG: ABC transporter permease [Candidatus Hodarchaeales archaeon]